MINFDIFRTKAIQWMITRGWKEKLAKRKGFEQSLFEHTLCELDALITFFSIWADFSAYNRLTLDEQKILLVAALLHDLGKETDAWQKYILGKQSGYVSHCDESLLKEVLSEILPWFSLENSAEIISAVMLHMRSASTPGYVFAQAALGHHSNPRWKMLADLVAQIDNFCSAKGLFGGLTALERCDFIQNLSIDYHQVNLRGLSTTLLHKAAMECFLEKGWLPLMHYANGTIYAASPQDNCASPTRQEIHNRLTEIVQETLLGREFHQQVVGSPVASMLPKPDLFDYREFRLYLKTAAGRIGRASFKKKSEAEQQRVAEEYMRLSKTADAGKEWQLQAIRIAEARPEMLIFKVFKTALSEKLIDPAKLKIDQEADRLLQESCHPETPQGEKKYLAEIKKAQKKIWDGFQTLLAREYEQIFGQGSLADLLNTSTLMPAKDMARTIDYFWALPASRFDRQAIPDQVEFLRSEDRENLLVELLAQIAEKVFASLSEDNRPSRLSPETVADQFIKDLTHPLPAIPFQQVVNEQLKAYTQSKPLARKEGGQHLCPQCNWPFYGGSSAKADFLNNPEAHTNRAAAHSRPGYIVICDHCRYERFLEQLILGGKPAKTLVLFPRMGIGPGAGSLLQEKAKQIWTKFALYMSDRTPDPSLNISFGLTSEIAKKLAGQEAWGLSAEAVADLLTYRTSKETEKKRRKALENLLKENIGSQVEDLNSLWMTEYPTWDEAVDALIQGQVMEGESLRYRAESFSLTHSLEIICQTPHMILVSLQNPLGIGKESDTNAGLRELFILMILGLALDCTAASLADGEVISFEGGEGVARVPGVSALRNLIGSEWVGISEATRWIRAIASASQLIIATDYPDRSNLYQILTALTAGHILRRIEQKSEAGTAAIYHLEHLKNIEPVLK